jgi:outer membrane protein TolC
VKATLASRTADRIAAQQTFAEARRQLAIDMGLSTADVLTLSDPEDDFPAIQSERIMLDSAIVNDYVALALRSRPDALAARQRKIQADMLLYSAQQSTKPQVNLQFGSGYSQLLEGGAFSNFFGSLASNLHRPDLQAGVTYQFAHANNLAEGQKLQAEANAKEAELKVQDLERRITAGVAIAAESVEYSQQRVKSAREAVEAFRHTLDGEKEEYRLGQVSLTELLTLEDRLTAALSNQVSAELDYADALLDLRATTGTLLRSNSNLEIDTNAFVTLPENLQNKVDGVQR